MIQNNAGTAFGGLSTRELILKTLDTNVAGLAVTTEKFTPLLEKAKFPRVVNLSSPLGSLTWMSDPSHPASRLRNIVSYHGLLVCLI
jgi:NAD(P)-dependent dehydrogenase (short-subunit alcohol dehydrogenase family)